jgi:hypothetical protein
MVLVVYGFPSKTAALRFEWGWTYPQKCTYMQAFAFKLSSSTIAVSCARQPRDEASMLTHTRAPHVLLTARRLTEALSQRNIGKIGSPHMLKARLRYITPLFASIAGSCIEFMRTHRVCAMPYVLGKADV